MLTTLSKFEGEIENKLGRSITVGTREYLLEKAKNEGVMLECSRAEKLLAEERKKVLETKNYNIVSNLVLDYGFTDEQAAGASQTPLEFVQKVRADLAEKQKK